MARLDGGTVCVLCTSYVVGVCLSDEIRAVDVCGVVLSLFLLFSLLRLFS